MDLQTVVARYRRTLVELPDDIFATDAVEVYPQLGNERSWKVDIDLWTKEEGRSDLTLQVMVEEDPDQVRVQIEDLHVL